MKLLNQPEVKERFSNIGAQTIGSSPEELELFVKSDMAKWGKLIKDAGIRE